MCLHHSRKKISVEFMQIVQIFIYSRLACIICCNTLLKTDLFAKHIHKQFFCCFRPNRSLLTTSWWMMVFGDVISRNSEKEGTFIKYRQYKPKRTKHAKENMLLYIHFSKVKPVQNKKSFLLTKRSVAGKGNCHQFV